MFALFASRTATQLETPERLKPSRAEADVSALLVRMQQRCYPETIPVLASYWLKSVWRQEHNRHEIGGVELNEAEQLVETSGVKRIGLFDD